MQNDKLIDFWNAKWDNVKTDIGVTAFGKRVHNFLLEKNYNFLGKRILDIGAGVGRDSLFFARSYPLTKITAQDPSKGALDKIGSFARQQELGNIDLLQTDVLHDNIDEENYDILYACNSLHYFRIEDFEIIITKIHRALSMGGIFCLRVKARSDSKYGKGSKIEDHYYQQGEDTKYFFALTQLRELLEKFDGLLLEEKLDHQELTGGGSRINSFIDFIGIKK